MFALRTSARLLSSSAPVLLRATAPKTATRAFSSSLNSILQKEIEVAKEEIAGVDDNAEFNDFKKDILKLFKIEDQAGHSTVKMTRQHKSEVITVAFDCQDTADDYDSYDDEEREEESDEVELGLNFEATVEKGNAKLTAQCVAGPSGLRVRYIQKGASDDKNAYTGPEFSTLDENLQEELFKWLDERKIDEDLSTFIHAYAQQKEHKEYLHWLEDMNSFFTSK